MDHDRTLAPSPFPGDDGRANPRTREALDIASAPTSPADYLRAVAALCLDRVLVPVVASTTRPAATAGSATPTGDEGAGDKQAGDEQAGGKQTGDKEAEMSVVLLQTRDGRRAMLAFTGMDSLRAWDSSARPVPVTLDVAAKSARADGAAALLVDFAGPSALVIEGEVLAELASGHRLVEVGTDEFGWAVRRAQQS